MELKPKCIVTYRSNFYDITEFIHKHPGGINTLKGLEKSDITRRFLNAPKHSNSAMYLLNEYKIIMNKNVANDYLNEIKFSGNNEIKPVSDETTSHKKTGAQVNDIKFNNIILDDSMEYLVDWSKPMLIQIAKISEYYNEWVHKPVDRPLRLFESWYLEMLSKTPWWIIAVFWLPIICYILFSEVTSPAGSLLTNTTILFHLIMGLFLWTFIEYILHRWIFHRKISSQNKKLCIFHFLIHGLHHKVPFDAYRLVFPPFPALIISSILYIPVLGIFPYPRITFSGGLLGYLCYDLMHYYLHYGKPMFRYMYLMKRYHYQHHFTHQDIGFGVTSSLWDFIFRTQIYLKPLKFKIKW